MDPIQLYTKRTLLCLYVDHTLDKIDTGSINNNRMIIQLSSVDLHTLAVHLHRVFSHGSSKPMIQAVVADTYQWSQVQEGAFFYHQTDLSLRGHVTLSVIAVATVVVSYLYVQSPQLTLI